MDIKKKHDDMYMGIALRVAQESYCVRRKVGSVIVTPKGVTLIKEGLWQENHTV